MSHPNSNAIQVTDLSRRFGDFIAVNGISFEVKQGSVFGFLGPNGSGKTTTIRMLCGILSPSGGQGSVAGYDINSQYEEIKAHIGYVSQRFSLYGHLTVIENLRFFSGIYGVSGPDQGQRISRTMELMSLKGMNHRLTSTLSGGWRQRLALAAALVHSPAVLFLDEPTAGADPITRRQFWDLILQLAREGTTIFVSTHYLEEAEYCQRLALIHRGRIISEGGPKELKDRFAGVILRVQSSDPVGSLELLNTAPEFRDVSLRGDAIQVLVDHREQGEEAIRQRLAARGIQVKELSLAAPALEDVFVSLVGQDELGETPGEGVSL